jgi:hypothetical protein
MRPLDARALFRQTSGVPVARYTTSGVSFCGGPKNRCARPFAQSTSASTSDLPLKSLDDRVEVQSTHFGLIHGVTILGTLKVWQSRATIATVTIAGALA